MKRGGIAVSACAVFTGMLLSAGAFPQDRHPAGTERISRHDASVREAQAQYAKMVMQVSEANARAEGKSSLARTIAASSRNDADYSLAKERCGVLAGEAKELCLDEADLRYGKS
jgi:hypothetical protein